MITLNELMEHAARLSPIPQSMGKLAALVADERSTIDQIIRVIEYDQVLTAHVLRYANSAASASQRRIDTVKDAVIRIGAGRMLAEVVAGHVRDDMRQPIDGYGYGKNELWRHSVAAAVVAEQLGTFTGKQISGISFTAALLHDLGKLVLGRAIGEEEAHSIFQSIHEHRDQSFEIAEQRLIGYSHAQIGAMICESWNLPEQIVKAIRLHHSTYTEDDPVVDSVKLSNMVARVIGEGIGFEGMAFIIDTEVARRFGLSKESFETLCARVKHRFNEVIETFEQ